MASFRKRGPYQWQAQIRKKGQPLQTKTFETHAEAEQWARAIEVEMDKGVFVVIPFGFLWWFLVCHSRQGTPRTPDRG